MDFGLRVPSRVAIAFAGASWMIFHVVAAQTATAVAKTRPGDIAEMAQQSFIHFCAAFLQYAVPFCLLIGVLASLIKRRRARSALSKVRGNPVVGVRDLSWRDFERLVGESFREQGFAVQELGGNGPDGGVDLVLVNDTKRYLVQCKHWKVWHVGVSTVRELNGVISVQKADGGFVVTSGRFTKEVQDFAGSCGIKLIDGSELNSWLKFAKSAATAPENQTVAGPSCPKCGRTMAKKIANQGQFKGQPFWSCSAFPKCWGKLHID